MSKKDSYAVVTDRIIEALEQGLVPWHRPWKSVSGDGPMSLSTGKPYRGINVWILGVTAQLRGYSSPYWTTFKQAKERGGNVRKGEKGTQVVLWKPVTKENKDSGETEKFLIMRHFTVFNLDQCEGVEAPVLEPLPEHEPIETAEAISHRFLTTNGPTLRHGGDAAYYAPFLDTVQMPVLGAFETPEHYYGTLFHEYAHSTAHESRLNRKDAISNRFGDASYSKEELVAEMTAAFLCGEADIPVNVQHHVGYLQNWLEAFKGDRKMIVQAAAAAQKAADYVLGREAQKKEEPASAAPLGQSTEGARRCRTSRLSLVPNRATTTTATRSSRLPPAATVAARGTTLRFRASPRRRPVAARSNTSTNTTKTERSPERIRPRSITTYKEASP